MTMPGDEIVSNYITIWGQNDWPILYVNMAIVGNNSGNNSGGNGLCTNVWDLLWTLCHIAIGNRQPPGVEHNTVV